MLNLLQLECSASNASKCFLLRSPLSLLFGLSFLLIWPYAAVGCCSHITIYSKSFAPELKRRPMINPKSPSTDEKISITKIFTNLDNYQ